MMLKFQSILSVIFLISYNYGIFSSFKHDIEFGKKRKKRRIAVTSSMGNDKSRLLYYKISGLERLSGC